MKMMRTMYAIVAATMLFGCGVEGEDDFVPGDLGDLRGMDELKQPLAALATVPTFTVASGTLALTFAAGGETAWVYSHPVTGVIYVNGVSAFLVGGSCTTTTLKKVTALGAAAVDVLIADFTNGTFAPGITGAGGQGWTITNWGFAGADQFKLRGSSTAADTVTIGTAGGATAVSFNTDAFVDMSFPGAVLGVGGLIWTFGLGGGNDVFSGSVTASYGITGRYNDVKGVSLTVYGGTGNDTLTGGDGNDVLNGDEGDDTLAGGVIAALTDGNDVFNGSVAGGAADSDTVSYTYRTAVINVTIDATANDGIQPGEDDNITATIEIVRGGSNNDTFTGSNAGNETFYGGAGADLFVMGTLLATGGGSDTVYGEAGSDTVDYSLRVEAINVSMTGTANDGSNIGGVSPENDNIQTDVENVICPRGAGLYNCAVTGNALDNVIIGGDGDDTVLGGSGDDTFVVGLFSNDGLGADLFSGESGVDTVYFADFQLDPDGVGPLLAPWVMVAPLAVGVIAADTSYGAAETITMDGVAAANGAGNSLGKKVSTDTENVVCTLGANVCTLVGNAANNYFIGGGAIDVFNGGAGDDYMDGGALVDLITCGSGTDVMEGADTNVAADCEL